MVPAVRTRRLTGLVVGIALLGLGGASGAAPAREAARATGYAVIGDGSGDYDGCSGYEHYRVMLARLPGPRRPGRVVLRGLDEAIVEGGPRPVQVFADHAHLAWVRGGDLFFGDLL